MRMISEDELKNLLGYAAGRKSGNVIIFTSEIIKGMLTGLEAGLISFEIARQVALAEIKEFYRFLENSDIDADLSSWVPEYYKAGLITLDEARHYALEEIKLTEGYYVKYYLLEEAIVTVEDVRPFALEALNFNPGWVTTFFEVGLINLETARDSFFTNWGCYDMSMIAESFRAGIITLEEARELALKDSNLWWSEVTGCLMTGILTLEEDMPLVLKSISKEVGMDIGTLAEATPFLYTNKLKVGSFCFFKAGLITLEEARTYAFNELREGYYGVEDYYKAGIITLEDAREMALGRLVERPYLVNRYIRAGILTQDDLHYSNVRPKLLLEVPLNSELARVREIDREIRELQARMDILTKEKTKLQRVLELKQESEKIQRELASLSD